MRYFIPHNWTDTIKVVIASPRKHLRSHLAPLFVDRSNRLTAAYLKAVEAEIEALRYAHGDLPPHYPLPVKFSLLYNVKMDMMVNGVLLKAGWTSKEIMKMRPKGANRP